MAESEFKKLGLTFMEVSAKTGSNIKEFFKDLAYMTAVGKKEKAEGKTQVAPQIAPSQPPAQNLSLSAHQQKEPVQHGKKKKCCG
jgi:hypothetical protein